MENDQNRLIVFQEKTIRRTWHNDEWWFAVIDVLEVLTESTKPRDYWYRLKNAKRKAVELNCRQFVDSLKMVAPDGKTETECANTEGMLRIIQKSIPSPKAEPFKQWLARVGYERVQEIENPELAAERARQYYKDLGYSEEWIATRLKSIEVRGQLTDEWKDRDVKEGLEYAILTAEISKATFGLKPSEYKNLKGLQRENLRDHMTNLELIFSMLGEEQTRQEAIGDDAQGFDENRQAAIKGGTAAGKALGAFEDETGKKVVTDRNFKEQIAVAKAQKNLTGKKTKEEKEE
ncbi:MAG: Bro-N domain-containing protein [Bacteroidia bacterium]